MKQPFFIVGAGRSGSELLYRILRTHSKIALTSEARVADFLLFAVEFGSVPRGQDYTFDYPDAVELHGMVAPWEIDHWSSFLRERAPRLLEEWYEARFSDREFTHWGDKLPIPRTTAALQTVFPNARFLVLVRDPRGFLQSVLDMRARDGARALDPHLVGRPVERIVTDWRNSYGDFLRYLRHTHVVRYEDLVLRTPSVVTDALAFLELELESALLADDVLQFATRHATSASVEQSMSRWQTELPPGDLRCVTDLCGELMQRFGYA